MQFEVKLCKEFLLIDVLEEMFDTTEVFIRDAIVSQIFLCVFQQNNEVPEPMDLVEMSTRKDLEAQYGNLRKRQSRSSLDGEEEQFSRKMVQCALYYYTHKFGCNKTETESSTVNFLSFIRGHVKRVSV